MLRARYGFSLGKSDIQHVKKVLTGLPVSSYSRLRLGLLLESKRGAKLEPLASGLVEAFYTELTDYIPPCTAAKEPDFVGWFQGLLNTEQGVSDTSDRIVDLCAALLHPTCNNWVRAGMLTLLLSTQVRRKTRRRPSVKTDMSDAAQLEEGLFHALRVFFVDHSEPDLVDACSAILHVMEESRVRLEQENTSLQQQVAQLQESLDERERRLKEKSEETSALTRELQEQHRQIRELQEKSEELDRQLEHERVRHKQKEELLAAKLEGEKRGSIAKLRRVIMFELSEMEEALISIAPLPTERDVGI